MRVTSSMINDIKWRAYKGNRDFGLMTVRFHNGADYEYAGVSRRAYQQLTQADSIGKHFHANIKGRYNTRRLP